MHDQTTTRLEAITDDELDHCVGGGEPQNGMQWLGQQAHHLWNHVCAAVGDAVQIIGQAEAAGALPL